MAERRQAPQLVDGVAHRVNGRRRCKLVGRPSPRQVQTGLPAHRDLDVDEVVDILSPPETEAGEPAPPRPAYDWAAANQKKKEAIAQLASLSASMDDIDTRINQLIDRTRSLELD